MIDKNAIQLLASTKDVIDANEKIELHGPIVPLVAHHQNVEVRSIESFMQYKSRFSQRISTNNLESFVRYVSDNHNDDSECYVDSSDMSALTIIDLGTKEKPLHRVHRAILQLLKTQAYKQVLNMVDLVYSQQGLAEFFEDWTGHINILDQNNEPMSSVDAAKAVRTVKVTKESNKESVVGNYSNHQSELEKIEANADSAKPSLIRLTCAPYQGLEVFTFSIRVNMLVKEDGKPKFRTRVVMLEDAVEKISEGFQAKLRALLVDTKVAVYIGSVQ